jgi:hypothetical protein
MAEPWRIRFTTDALHGLAEAIAGGADVRGYVHWSLLDTFGWMLGTGRPSAWSASTGRPSSGRRSRAWPGSGTSRGATRSEVTATSTHGTAVVVARGLTSPDPPATQWQHPGPQ